MSDPFKMARQFNEELLGYPIPRLPTPLTGEQCAEAFGHLNEEARELYNARTVEDQVDALVDSIYVAMGRLSRIGVDGMAHFEEVHRANMAKVRGSNQKRPLSAAYDAVKPPGWQGPDHAAVIGRCAWRDYNEVTVERPSSLPLADRVEALVERQGGVLRSSVGAAVAGQYGVRRVPKFTVGQHVRYSGPEERLRGKAARVIAVHYHTRRDTPTLDLVFNDPTVPLTEVAEREAELWRPKLVVIGYARHGKDTACEMLRDRYGLRFTSSSLFCAERVVFPVLGPRYAYDTPERCFEDRGAHRKEWFDLIAQYTAEDPSRLGREILADNDVYCGVRRRGELEAIKAEGLADAVIWVDASHRVPPEPFESCSVQRGQADYVLDNNGHPDLLGPKLSAIMLDLAKRQA